MPLKTQPLEEPAINLTSMLDVVMLLIIFFMVGTRFSEEERQTNIQVPAMAANSTLTGTPDEIVINIDETGHAFVKGEAYTPSSLLAMLKSAQQAFPNQAVVIRGDGRCNYQQVIDALDTCKAAGLRNFSIAHLPKK